MKRTGIRRWNFATTTRVLGVERSATETEIRSAYRKLARKFHPDVNPNNKDAEARFKELNEAYQVISDTEKRKKYDKLGADWERGVSQEERCAATRGASAAGAGGGAGIRRRRLQRFLSRFFGGLGGGSARGGRSAAPSRVFRLRFRRAGRRAHPTCTPRSRYRSKRRSGAKRRLDLAAEDECETCGGSGMIAREERRGKARVIRSAEPCRDAEAAESSRRAARSKSRSRRAYRWDENAPEGAGRARSASRPERRPVSHRQVQAPPGVRVSGRDLCAVCRYGTTRRRWARR